MAGRNTMPIDVLKQKGKSHHVTKEEENQRRQSENKIKKLDLDGLKNVKMPTKVKDDLKAAEYWNLQFKHYVEAAERGIYILALSDIDIFTEYCIVSSRLDKINKRLNSIVNDDDYANVDIDMINKFEIASNRLLKNKIVLSDKLFLNPIARIKNVPTAEIEKEKTEEEMMFDI